MTAVDVVQDIVDSELPRAYGGYENKGDEDGEAGGSKR